VYDPFLGTGTTVVASEITGRLSRGLELDPAYCDVVNETKGNYILDYPVKKI
jgi:DNA modification methylase